jgi:isocitrate lyase
MATRSVSHSRVHLHREELNSSTDLARRLMDLKSLAMNLEGFQLGSDDRNHHPALVSTREAVQRLASAKLAADSLHMSLRVFACTDARMAAAVSTDADRRDHKFLSGSRTSEGFHTYCGGLDAAVSRGLVFAQYADVVCFRSNGADLFEAARFAASIKSRFPAISLAYGHNATQNGLRWNELDHRAFAEKLQKIGYDTYFVTQFGQTTFPYTPIAGPWVLLNDTVCGKSVIPEDLRRPAVSTLPLSPGTVSRTSLHLGA